MEQATAPTGTTDVVPTPTSGEPAIGAGNKASVPDQGKSVIASAAAEAKRKLKIDDQEIDEDEVFKVYKERKGHQRAANKEMQEGLKAKKQAEEFISMMKDKGKLFEAIKKLGHDPRQLSEEYLAALLQEEMMDPKEKELKDTRTKLKTYEEQEEARKKEAEKARNEELKAKYAKDYSDQFIEALKTTNLPATKEMVASMAKYISRAAQLKFPMTALEAAKLVQQDEDQRIEHRLKNATPEQIIQILKEEGVQKVRAYDTSRLKDPNALLKTPEKQTEVTRKRDAGSKRMTEAEWREFNRK